MGFNYIVVFPNQICLVLADTIFQYFEFIFFKRKKMIMQMQWTSVITEPNPNNAPFV